MIFEGIFTTLLELTRCMNPSKLLIATLAFASMLIGCSNGVIEDNVEIASASTSPIVPNPELIPLAKAKSLKVIYISASGMNCPKCVLRTQNAVRKVYGIVAVVGDPKKETVTVTFDASKTTSSKIIESINSHTPFISKEITKKT